MISKCKPPTQKFRKVNKTCKTCGIKLDKENAVQHNGRSYIYPNCKICKKEINRKNTKKKADLIKAQPLW